MQKPIKNQNAGLPCVPSDGLEIVRRSPQLREASNAAWPCAIHALSRANITLLRSNFMSQGQAEVYLMQDNQKAALSKATAGHHYCDLILTSEEAVELKALVQQLLSAGRHPALAGVFKGILEDTWSADGEGSTGLDSPKAGS